MAKSSRLPIGRYGRDERDHGGKQRSTALPVPLFRILGSKSGIDNDSSPLEVHTKHAIETRATLLTVYRPLKKFGRNNESIWSNVAWSMLSPTHSPAAIICRNWSCASHPHSLWRNQLGYLHVIASLTLILLARMANGRRRKATLPGGRQR